jgi:carboxyl-terminal processing protease
MPDRKRHLPKICTAPAALAVLSAVALTTGCATTPREPPLTKERRRLNLESFDYVWTTIRDKYSDPELGGLDWQAVHDESSPLIEEADTMGDARRAMRYMISRLGQSHFAIISAEAYESMDRPASAAPPSIVERLPDGDGLQYAIANYVSKGGEVLEGAGVTSDIEVIPTREALLQGKDPVCDAAIAWIRDQE